MQKYIIYHIPHNIRKCHGRSDTGHIGNDKQKILIQNKILQMYPFHNTWNQHILRPTQTMFHG